MGVVAQLLTAACVATHAAGAAAAPDTAATETLRGAQPSSGGHAAPALQRRIALASQEADEWPHRGAARELLHGCHQRGGRSCQTKLPTCPRCRFPNKRTEIGHCKAREGGALKLFNCPRRTGTKVPRAPLSIAESIIGSAQCPTLHASSWPGHFDLPHDAADYEVDYYYEPEDAGGEDLLLDYFTYDDYTPQFRAVVTPDELQEALQAGTKHILILAHLDMTSSTPEPDLPETVEALNNAIGRVSSTTLSIAGWCEEPPPRPFRLTEPVPPGACAILVREDFLDAPLGTTCLLLDSLYVAVRHPGPRRSSVLVLHVDGLMWITNCVFQGAGRRSRAIDTNTINGGSPELYVKDTTFTGFSRNSGPGIRMLNSSRLWLDNVTFRGIERLRHPQPEPQGTAVAAYDDVLLVLMNVLIEDNVVLGEPAGNQAVSISPNGTEAYASPRLELWQWPDGPAVMSDEDTSIARFIIENIARPQLETIQNIQDEIIMRELRRDPP